MVASACREAFAGTMAAWMPDNQQSGTAAAWIPSNRQSGAALIMGLLLLTVLTLVSSTAMRTATLQFVMSSNVKFFDQAFQAAETGIDLAIAQGSFNLESPSAVPRTLLDSGTASTEAVIVYSDSTPVPDAAFSMGEDSAGLQAFHFEITAVGMGPRNAVSTHRQGFYIIGPEGPSEP